MTIRLGVAPIAWSNSDLPQLGGDTPLETCLAESRQAGYSGTETGVKFPMDPAVLGPLLEAHRLALVSGWFSGNLLELSVADERERIADQLATFKALGAPVMVYAETTGSVQAAQDRALSTRPRLDHSTLERLGAKMTELARFLADEGVPMSYHPHMGTVIETEDEIDALMAATGDEVGLLIDTGHLTYAGADVRATMTRHQARINHVHCKDVRADVLARAREGDMSFLDAVLEGVFTVPGDGCVDFAEVARLLAAMEYAGWVVVEAEQDPAKAPPLEYAEMGYRHLTEALGAAGLRIEEARP